MDEKALFRTLILVAACAASASAQIRPRASGSGLPAPPSRTDESLIRAARAQSNQAIARHDLAGLARHWLPEFTMISSTNERSVGRDAARSIFRQVFASRANVVYVREPGTIEVNAEWGQAAEHGRWTGRWSDSYGNTRVGGVYFAKWRKVNDRWMLLAEVFVQTHCSGPRYCRTVPAPLDQAPDTLQTVANADSFLTVAKDTVVVADDDRVIVALVADALRKAGFHVFPAFDSMQAMLGARQHNPKAIILDVGMPGGSGMDVLKKIKAMNKLSQIPIIVLTGSTDPALREQALAAGAEEFLTKPVDIPAVLAAVRKALGLPEPPSA